MLKRRKNYNLIKIASAALCLIIAFTAATFGWFSRYNTIDFPNAYGGTAKAAYFASGDGSKNDPYKIKTAVHLYNFAWLQYLGYFNLNPTLNNGRAQSYFELADNVDMSILKSALPPIGTSQYPFIGGFNGANYRIYNLTVSNQKSDLTVRPLNAHIADSSATNAGRLLAATQNSEVSVVGLFGVVGDYNAFLADNYNGKTVAGAEIVINDSSTDFPADLSQIAVNEFYHKGMYVKNFYVDKVHVKSYSKRTLLGLAAGYVNAAMQNVGVYRSDASFAAGATGLTDDYGAVVSKYSLIGDYNKNAVSWNEDPTAGSTGGGGDGGWGGSIGMESLHTRVASFLTYAKENKQYVDSAFNDSQWASGSRRYYDEKKGSVYLKYSSDERSFLYMFGGLLSTSYSVGNVEQEGFFIKYNNNYLTVSRMTETGTGAVTNKDNAVTWYFDDDGGMYTYRSGEKAYLDMNNYYTLTLSSVKNNYITRQMQGESSGFLYNSNANKYVQYKTSGSSGLFKGDSDPQTLTFESTKLRRSLEAKRTYTITLSTGQRNIQSYIPINTDENYNASDNNTGYIASGPHDTNADIRIGWRDVSTISNSVGSITSINAETRLEILTCSKKSGGFKRIIDLYNTPEIVNNPNLTETSSGISTALTQNYGAMTVSDFGFTNYSNETNSGTRDQLQTLLVGKSKLYGLHFMNAQVNLNNLYRADKAYILGKEYTNYQMTANSIDFQVKSRGAIKFFAASNYNQNKNFFSLYQIERSGETIVSVKEIKKIYSKKSSSYIYQYDDGSFSGGYETESSLNQDGYALEFDCLWITNPEMVENSLYYFEIPVNAGEYALGSANTGNGAYLLYLDIGANGDDGGDEPSPGTGKDYYMSSVDFVNTPSVTPDANGAYPAFKDVTVALSGVSETESAQTIYMRNNDGLTDSAGQIADTLRYKYKNITAVVSPSELGDDKSDDDTFVPSTDAD